MAVKKIARARTEDARRVELADHDIRYVPCEGRLCFSGLAHETRYLWLIQQYTLADKSVSDRKERPARHFFLEEKPLAGTGPASLHTRAGPR